MFSKTLVIRRVGGLEEPRERNLALEVVIRRVGGLEVTSGPARIPAAVIRRVGGLEGVGGITCESSAIDEETEAR